jgi:hypothetical protein
MTNHKKIGKKTSKEVEKATNADKFGFPDIPEHAAGHKFRHGALTQSYN